jgi:hypothetical protein
MFVPVSKIPESARVWVYSSNRFFTDIELKKLSSKIQTFLSKWTAHNQSLMATSEIKFNRHIIIAVDEAAAKASGCSIDSCVNFMQNLGMEFNFNPLDRLHYTFFENGKPFVVSHQGLNDAFEKGDINWSTQVVNPLVKIWMEYQKEFTLPLEDSFLVRFIDTETANT